MKSLLIAQLVSTLFMTGLIWCIQLVHYPLFARVGDATFAEYEQDHQRRITWIVMPVMLVELVSSVMLLNTSLRQSNPAVIYFGIALLAVIWISTAVLQVPLHNTLTAGLNRRVVDRLVSTNWIRTVCWSVRSALVVWLFAKLAFAGGAGDV